VGRRTEIDSVANKSLFAASHDAIPEVHNEGHISRIDTDIPNFKHTSYEEEEFVHWIWGGCRHNRHDWRDRSVEERLHALQRF
jgi:hypothetical protein